MTTLQTIDVRIRVEELEHTTDMSPPSSDAPPEFEYGLVDPYVWITYFKIDGEGAYLDKELQVRGSSTIESRRSIRLADMYRGEHRRIPVVGGEEALLRPGFATRLMPIPLEVPIFDVTHVGGTIGCAVVLWEEDGTPQDARDAGHAAFNEALRKELDRYLGNLSITQPQPTEQDLADCASSPWPVIHGPSRVGVGHRRYGGGRPRVREAAAENFP